MPETNPTRVDPGDLWTAQRAIVLQLLSDDHDPRWTRPELEGEIPDVPQPAILAALAYLAVEEVISLDDEAVWASRCARYLDELDLLGI